MTTYADVYITLADLWALGLSAQAFAVAPRPIEDVSVSLSTLQLTAHGFTSSSVITFPLVGPMSVGAPPSPLVPMTPYYPIVVTDSLFQVAATPNGSPITLTDAGSGAYGCLLDQYARINEQMWATSRNLDEVLTGELPPIKPDPSTGLYPGQLVGIAARECARSLIATMSFDNAAFRVVSERLDKWLGIDEKTKDGWKLGKPLQPRPVDQDNIANNGARASASSCPDRWVIRAL